MNTNMGDQEYSPESKEIFKSLKLSVRTEPLLCSIIDQFQLEYHQLSKSIQKEKSEEAKNVEVKFNHILHHWVDEEPGEFEGKLKIGTPVIMSKIDSPYKYITVENITRIRGKQFPKLWRMKSRIELKCFRNFFYKPLNGDDFDLVSHQESSFSFIKKLFSISHASSESNTIIKFAEALVKTEKKKISLSMIGKERSENCMTEKDYEAKLETARYYWVLDLLETVNKNIMMAASVRQNDKELQKNISYYEGKRINSVYYPIGASVTVVEFMGSKLKLNIFLSSTLTAYHFSDSFHIHIGRLEMLDYTMYLADNMVTMCFYNDICDHEEEKRFITYYKSLLDLKHEERSSLSALYESTCLLMSDYKKSSAAMPILDNIVDSISISPKKTEELVHACLKASGSTCIRMSGIAKSLIIAGTEPSLGLSRYSTRTNRNHSVNPDTIRRLRAMFRMKVVNSYIKKHGRVPQLYNVPDDLLENLELKAARGNYNGAIVMEVNKYKEVVLGKMLDPGAEMNIQSRIIDKACTKDCFDPMGNSEKEIEYYIKNDTSLIFSENIKVSRDNYENAQNSDDPTMMRSIEILDRFSIPNVKFQKYFTVRLSEKEREQKVAARFYGIASFKLKLWISSMMELIKRAMKLLPGQMMTMTDDERREIMFKMSEKLKSDNSYSLFLDYSGHNTSQRPDNTLFLLEEICNMYGYKEGSTEYDELTSVAFLFYEITVIAEDSWSDDIYVSKGQLGAIEGWFGCLWGIQSQLMLDDMFSQMGFRDYIGTTYSDDSCGVFIQQGMNTHKLNEIVLNIQKYGRDMGLLVKLSQTQVTNGRCSMLKEHYYEGEPVDMSLKKLFSISPNGQKTLGDQLESVSLIDSGYTSACLRATDITFQTTLRNMRLSKLLASSMKDFICHLYADEMDHRYQKSIGNFQETMKMSNRMLKKNRKGGVERLWLPSERSDTINFLLFHIKSEIILQAILSMLYTPYTMYGYSVTPMPDALISGYSLSNVKRISYIMGMMDKKVTYVTGKLINFSRNATSYIDNPFPLIGGRKDTKNLLKDAVGGSLEKVIVNPELLKYVSLMNEESAKEFKESLVLSFSDCFSSRIVSKFYEESVFSYLKEIVSKVENTSTMKMLLGGKELMRIIDKAWTSNYRMNYKINEHSITNYDLLVLERDSTEKFFPGNTKIDLKFIRIEEVPIMGKVKTLSHNNVIFPVYKGMKELTEKGKRSFPPSKTFHNTAKFDRELGVENMFEHKLIFKAYDLVRHVKWIIMESEKFGYMNKESIYNLVSVCNASLNTFSDVNYADIEQNVVCPKGGRYFHRALTAGFNPKTGDLSSNKRTSHYDISGVDQLLEKTGGYDNNLNVQYLNIYVKVCLSIINPRPDELMPLGFSSDMYSNICDVTFSLNGVKEFINPRKYNFMTDLISGKISTRGKLYYNYSTYISLNEDLKDKFINHITTTKQSQIEDESRFIMVHSYMTDQMMLSPDLISDDVLEQLIGKEKFKIGREMFFRDFYSYYRSLNIIGNETPAKSVIRGLLYETLFSINSRKESGELWISEVIKRGYSTHQKSALMRLFVLSTSLAYRLTDTDGGRVRITMNLPRTILNGKTNYEHVRSGKYHFYIKDKRITEMLLNSFPALGYSYMEIKRSCEELFDEINGMEFEQLRLGSYFLELHKTEIEKSNSVSYGEVEYTNMIIDPIDLADRLGVESAVKGFEMACQIRVDPVNVSSPTMSAVYPSAKGVLRSMIGDNFIKNNDKIIEMCGGRGDFHLAMSELNIEHRTISREDGYNLIYRIPGMDSKKVSFNCFKRQDYISYFNFDILLYDISHITDKDDCLSNLIGDAKVNKKKLIFRLNGLVKSFNNEVLKEIDNAYTKVYLPSLNSPGYIYLAFDFGLCKNTETSMMMMGYNRSILSNALVSRVGNLKLEEAMNLTPEYTTDQTHEVISDRILLDMLDEEDPTYINVNQEVKSKIKDKEDFLDNIAVYIDRSLAEKHKDSILEIKARLITRGDDQGCRNLAEIMKEMRSSNDNEIEVRSYITDNSYAIITGVKNCKTDALIEIVQDIVLNRRNKRLSKECWKMILEFSKDEKEIDTDTVGDMLNIQKFSALKMRAINSMYEMASHAVFSYKTGKISEGLLKAASLDNLQRKQLLLHKDKTTKNNILHYKLFMNRIMWLENFLGRSDLYAGISPELYDEMWYKRLKVKTDQEKQELISKIENSAGLDEFFMSDDTFSFLSNSLKNMILKVESDNDGRKAEDDVTNVLAGLLSTTEEEISLNRNLNTTEELMNYVGDEEYYESLLFDEYD